MRNMSLQLKYYPVEKLKQEILGITGKYLDLNQYKVFFFGSRVTGKAGERSDIDIGIEGATSVPLESFFKIEEEIEQLPILYKIEIVDFRKAPSKFREVARRKIEALN